MAEKKKIYLKKTAGGAQQYGEPKAFSRVGRKMIDKWLEEPDRKKRDKYDAAIGDMHAGWDAAMAEKYPHSKGEYEYMEKRDMERARKARGYAMGGEVCRGGGKAMSGTKFRGVK